MQPSARQRHNYFVTGTDTGVGKTLVSCALLQAAGATGLRTCAIKPVAAGALATPDGLRNEDALALQAAASEELTYAEVNPVCLAEPLSPHLAAQRAGRRVSVDRLAGFCQGMLLRRADLCLIEGAGGWRVPLNERETLADLAKQLRLPVILVVGLRLGCLNHALLSAEAILRDGLTLAGWVANTIDPAMAAREDNVTTLQRELPAPLLATVPCLGAAATPAQAVPHIDVGRFFGR
jgi:dethiobiotin synthetase